MGGASLRKMLRMQARPAGRVRQGPLLIPGRVLLLFSGLLALALSVFNLFHELHAAEVDRNYTIVALAIGVVLLASIILAFWGWLVGGLWIARVRRTGALLIALATFMICYSFVILHVRGGTPLGVIATKSGLIWAVIAAAVAILAAASLVAALGLLVIPIVRRTR